MKKRKTSMNVDKRSCPHKANKVAQPQMESARGGFGILPTSRTEDVVPSVPCLPR